MCCFLQVRTFSSSPHFQLLRPAWRCREVFAAANEQDGGGSGCLWCSGQQCTRKLQVNSESCSSPNAVREHKGCAVPVLEPAAAVSGCVRAAEALRKHSCSQLMALGRTCPWLAALGLTELCWGAANVLCQQPQLLGALSCVQGLGMLCSCCFSLKASWV